MKNIISFYIKSSLKLAFVLFLVAALCGFAIMFIPFFSEDSKYFIQNVTFFIMLPCYYFFNQKVLLSKSLDWILQTPTKKSHILIANGVINLAKVLILVIVVWLLINIFPDPNDKYRKAVETVKYKPIPYSPTSFQEMVNIFSFLFFLTTLCFGIFRFKDFKSKADYKIPTLFSRKNLKMIAQAVSFVALLYFAGKFLIKSIPEMFIFPLVFSILTHSICSMTLQSVRVRPIASSKNLKIGFISFLFLSILGFYWAYQDVNSDILDMKSKIHSVKLMGKMNFGGRKRITDEIKAGNKNLKDFSYKEIRLFFLHIQELNMGIISQEWEKQCSVRKDFTCRLAWYIQNGIEKNYPLDNMRVACKNDLRSCEIVHLQTTDERERKELEKVLKLACKEANRLSFDGKTCSLFERSLNNTRLKDFES